MHQEPLTYFDGEQKLLGELIYKKSLTGKNPAIIIYPAFEGIAKFALDYARQLAALGYVVLVADMYGDAGTSDTIEGCFKLVMPLLEDVEMMRRRAVLAYEAIAEQTNVDKKNIGAIGFCLGGWCALEAARSGANIKAVVGLHAAFKKSKLPTLSIKGSILLLHGYNDPQVPPDTLAGFAEEMEQANVRDWAFTFFGDTKHSFSDPRTGTFHPEKEMGRAHNPIAAERSYRYAIDFFQEKLHAH